jgi:hypothetical protein
MQANDEWRRRRFFTIVQQLFDLVYFFFGGGELFSIQFFFSSLYDIM